MSSPGALEPALGPPCTLSYISPWQRAVPGGPNYSEVESRSPITHQTKRLGDRLIMSRALTLHWQLLQEPGAQVGAFPAASPGLLMVAAAAISSFSSHSGVFPHFALVSMEGSEGM